MRATPGSGPRDAVDTARGGPTLGETSRARSARPGPEAVTTTLQPRRDAPRHTPSHPRRCPGKRDRAAAHTDRTLGVTVQLRARPVPSRIVGQIGEAGVEGAERPPHVAARGSRLARPARETKSPASSAADASTGIAPPAVAALHAARGTPRDGHGHPPHPSVSPTRAPRGRRARRPRPPRGSRPGSRHRRRGRGERLHALERECPPQSARAFRRPRQRADELTGAGAHAPP